MFFILFSLFGNATISIVTMVERAADGAQLMTLGSYC
jgi:hypothetical protein